MKKNIELIRLPLLLSVLLLIPLLMYVTIINPILWSLGINNLRALTSAYVNFLVWGKTNHDKINVTINED